MCNQPASKKAILCQNCTKSYPKFLLTLFKNLTPPLNLCLWSNMWAIKLKWSLQKYPTHIPFDFTPLNCLSWFRTFHPTCCCLLMEVATAAAAARGATKLKYISLSKKSPSNRQDERGDFFLPALHHLRLERCDGGATLAGFSWPDYVLWDSVCWCQWGCGLWYSRQNLQQCMYGREVCQGNIKSMNTKNMLLIGIKCLIFLMLVLHMVIEGKACYVPTHSPSKFFSIPQVVMLSLISRYALVQMQINSDATASQKNIWSRTCCCYRCFDP